MAAVDRRMGVVRRGMTPAAPRPINLPSQKLENQGLVPDVEIVPRGTFCWGSQGRPSAVSSKNNEAMDSASLPSGSSGAGDNGTRLQNDLISTDKLQGLAERSSPPLSVESSASPISSIACITSGETTGASSISLACISDAKTDSRSRAASDAGSLPDSVARPSSSESGTSQSAAPLTFNKSRVSVAKVEEQVKSNGFPEVGSDGPVKVPNLQPKQGTHGSSECLPESQDFGYFESFYSNHHTSSRAGMSYSNALGMAFGPGAHPEPSQHDGFYSFLGVPYYDSTKDKEIVVITMVGNPGFHGSYLPHSGFPDQYGRPGVYGNFPLQFGHFENFVVPGHCILDGMPPLSAEMSPMCSGEQGEFVCYEQEYYKDGWVNESSVGEMQRVNGAYLPTSFSTFKSNPNLQDYNMPKRSGRQKFSSRNKRAASKGASSALFTPERRVTLLTKVSQHEVVISSLQKKSKLVGNGQAPSFAQNIMEVPSCDPAIAPVETSKVDMLHEVVDNEKSHALESLSASEMILHQATCTGSNNEGSILLSSCNEHPLRDNSEISASESSSTSTATSTLTFQTHGRTAVRHQDTLAACSPGAVCEVPAAPSTNISSVIGPKREVRHVTFDVDDHIMNAAELPQDAPLYASSESAAPTEQASEHVTGEETLNITTAASLPHEHNQGSMPVLLNQKNDRKWRRKGFVAAAKLGQEHFNPKVPEAVVDKKASSIPSPNDKVRDVLSSAGADSLPTSTMGGKPISQCSVSLSVCAAVSFSGCEASAKFKENRQVSGSLDCTEPDSLPTIRKNRKVYKAVSRNGDLDSVPEVNSVQILESSKKTRMKSTPFEDGQSLNCKSASCGFGKAWRPKPPGAGHGKSATKVPRNLASQGAVTSKISGLEVTEPCLINKFSDPKHWLEVSSDDNSIDKLKQQQSHDKHSHEDMQNESCNRLSLSVDEQHTSINTSATCHTGIDSNSLRTKREKMEEHESSETWPLRNIRVEERLHTWRLIGKQVQQQQESTANKPEESKHIGRGDMPMRDDCCFEACGECSISSDANVGVDDKISKATKPSKFSSTSQGSQIVPALQVKQKSKEIENAFHVRQQSVNQPMLATQLSKFKDLTSELDQSLTAASGLPQQSSLRNCQEQRHLPVKNVPQRHAGPVHFMGQDHPAGSLARSFPGNFGTNYMKQGHFVVWGENFVRKRGSSLNSPMCTKISNHLQEGHTHSHLGKFQKAWNYDGQSMHRWQQQKTWNAKAMHLQEQQPGTTCSSVSKPCEGSRTFSDGKSNAENKQYVNLLQSASGVSWKPKQASVVQISKEGSIEEGRDNLSTSALQKKKTPEEGPVLEFPSSAPVFLPCGNEQVRKPAFRKPATQMREESEVCPVVTSSICTPLSSLCGSGQQVNNMEKQGFVKHGSRLKKAFDEGPVVASPSRALSSPSCGNGKHVSDMVKKVPVKPASQMKLGLEDCPSVTSFGSAPLSSPCGNGQQVGNTVKQSYKAALEMQHAAVTRKVSLSEEQAVFGPISQPVSSVASSMKLEDTPLTKTVKARRHHTSWRPKAVSGNDAAKAAFSKEVKENDPSASIHVEGAPKDHTHLLPSSKSAALNDLHVWKNNGRHPVRASYGLPYWRKDYPQQQKSVDHQAKLHAEAASSLELQNRTNEKVLDREFPRASFTREVKYASPHKQAETFPCREHPKFSQHHTYAVKQAQSTCNQHSTVGNRRPFSMRLNFSHDDNEKIVYNQQPLSRMSTEQDNRGPFSTKSIFSYDNSKKVVHHQQSLPGIRMEQGNVEGLCPSRGDFKAARRGRFRNGWKVADFDRKGWVVKTVTRC